MLKGFIAKDEKESLARRFLVTWLSLAWVKHQPTTLVSLHIHIEKAVNLWKTFLSTNQESIQECFPNEFSTLLKDNGDLVENFNRIGSLLPRESGRSIIMKSNLKTPTTIRMQITVKIWREFKCENPGCSFSVFNVRSKILHKHQKQCSFRTQN